jgi:uncharacterized membrane protein YfcA
MKKKFDKKLTGILFKVGIPYTIAGIAVVFAGIYALKHFFAQNEYLTIILFMWLAVFWFVYQPLFRRRIEKEKAKALARKK